jgi:hypothetical protein
MTKTVNIPLTELQEIYQGIEAFVLAVPGDAVALASYKEQLELRMAAARALGHLSAYVIYATPEPTMHDEYEYALDHYGLDNWQAEWGDGDIERDIVVKYDETHRGFDYAVFIDGEEVTSTLNADNRKAFEGLMEKERAQRRAISEDYAYD